MRPRVDALDDSEHFFHPMIVDQIDRPFAIQQRMASVQPEADFVGGIQLRKPIHHMAQIRNDRLRAPDSLLRASSCAMNFWNRPDLRASTSGNMSDCQHSLEFLLRDVKAMGQSPRQLILPAAP